ncbi:MAG: RNA polymerase sigma factor [Pseudomonadota bacterium]
MTADRALVDAVLAARPGAFERLVGEYQGLCWHIVFRLVRDPEDARDLCQETFLRVYRNLHQYRYDCPLKHWIGRVAYSIALRHLERRRIALGAELRSDEALLTPEDETETFDYAAACDDASVGRRLRAEIDALAPLPRMLLTLYHLDDMPIPEIARITGLPAGTIKSHLFRARLKLRERLETGDLR